MTRLLIVDDSAMDRRIAGGLLEKHGEWEIIEAENGHDALLQMELHVPDLVVTDLQMPLMNGLELVEVLQKEYPLVPVVLMTAQGSEEIAVQALERGAASYVPKRLLSSELVDTVERVIAASGSERSSTRLARRMTRLHSAFELESDPSLFPAVVGFLQQEAARMRFGSDGERLRMSVALEEALLNAYYHGNLEVCSTLRDEDCRAYYETARQRAGEDPYRRRQIDVEITLTPDECVLVVRDEGCGFDRQTIPDATDPANLDRPSGRGLLLMRTFMDDVRFNDAGNEVTMVKRRAAAPAVTLESEAVL